MKKNLGFTLIELLVVISIIGVLTTLILANLSDARGRARDSAKKSDLQQLKTALRLYYNDHQQYPTAATMPTSGTFSDPDGTTVYMKKLPTDFTYALGADDSSFYVKVTLENASDSDLAASKLRCPGSGAAATEYVVCED